MIHDVELVGYASRTNTRRNIAALRARGDGWGWLVQPFDRGGPVLGGLRHAIDNGAWHLFNAGRSFDADAFRRTIGEYGDGADFVVVPDIVMGGLASFDLSRSWLPELLASPHLAGVRLLVPVQDGMVPGDVDPLISDRVGIFVGGSTEWKVATTLEWGRYARSRGAYLHIARVNSARRIALCAAAGANSYDGTSATRYAETVPLLDGARRQRDLLVGVA